VLSREGKGRIDREIVRLMGVRQKNLDLGGYRTPQGQLYTLIGPYKGEAIRNREKVQKKSEA